MPLKVACAKCGGVLHAPEDAGGKKGRCPNCGNILPIPVNAQRVSDAGLPVPESQLPPSPFGTLPSTQAVNNPVPRPADNRGFGSTMSAPSSATTRAVVPPPAPVPNNPFAGAPAETGGRTANSTSSTPQLHAPGGKGWLRARKALGTIRIGLFFVTLGFVALAGVTLAEAFGVNLPNQDPGYAKIDGLPANSEIAVAALAVPAILGILLVFMGRIGFMGVPNASFAKGPATLCALFTALKIAGLVAFAFMTVMMIKEGSIPKIKSGYSPFMPKDSIPGQAQMFGLLAFVVAGLLAESFFLSALGRIGANLKHPKAASRATMACFLAGLGLLILFGSSLTILIYGNKELKSILDTWEALTSSKKLGYICGALGAIAVVGFLVNARAISASRDALQEAANRA